MLGQGVYWINTGMDSEKNTMFFDSALEIPENHRILRMLTVNNHLHLSMPTLPKRSTELVSYNADLTQLVE